MFPCSYTKVQALRMCTTQSYARSKEVFVLPGHQEILTISKCIFDCNITVDKTLVICSQIKKFPMETKLVNIYRPTQPLHKRHVYASRGTPLTPRNLQNT